MVNGLNAVEIVVGGVSGAAFGSIFDGITAVLRNASEFTTSHTNIKSTLEALQPLIREIEGKNNRLLLQDEELKDLKKEIEAGVKRVQELSEKSVWNYCMRPLYKKELDGMDESLKRLLRILQVQGVRDVKEVLVQVNDCKTDVSKISIQLDDCKTEIVEGISDLTRTVHGLVERIIGPSSFVPNSERVASLVEEDALGSSLLTMRHAVDEALSKPNPHYNIIFRIEEALRRVIEELRDADENRKLEEGTELILKCSNVVEWTDRKMVKYADKLDDLVKFLEAFGQRLKRTNSTMPEGFDTQNSIPCIKSSVDCAEQIADCPEETEEMNQGFPVSRAQGEWPRAESIGVSRRGALTWLRQMLIFKKSNRPTDDVNGLRNDLSVFSYSSILAATNNFAEENKLGQGGFGPVYKGKLAWGQEIAVKRLSKCSGQGTSQFKNELILKELQHTNVVQLFGFCIHGDKKMLIYEYLQNKSLDRLLFDPTRGLPLDWKKRFSILEGIAQGLLYLHKYSRKKVIHRDLKPSNILLDENMNPKISDFGLAMIFTQNGLEANTSMIVGTRGYVNPKISNFDMARIFIHDEDKTHITTTIAGTRGYIPPEAMMGIISVKFDVYSFGVLMLEIISGRKNSNFYNDDHTLNLVGYAWELWKEGAGLELMDPTLGNSFIKEQLLRCIHVGLLCVEENAADRPNMSDVVTMLINESLPLAPPTKPFYVGRRTVESQTDISWSQQSEFVASANYMSISDFESR